MLVTVRVDRETIIRQQNPSRYSLPSKLSRPEFETGESSGSSSDELTPDKWWDLMAISAGRKKPCSILKRHLRTGREMGPDSADTERDGRQKLEAWLSRDISPVSGNASSLNLGACRALLAVLCSRILILRGGGLARIILQRAIK